MKNAVNKSVESYFVVKHSEDMYCLIINTANRWCDYHRISDYEFFFDEAATTEEVVTEKQIKNHHLVIEEFLPKDKTFTVSVNQNKDQLSFYYMNVDILLDKTRDIIISKGGYLDEKTLKV